MNGYYNNQTIALVSEEGYTRVETYLEVLLGDLGVPYIIEDYNAKDLWWGSLPGLFRAATTPPICGFQTLEELLAVKDVPQATEAPSLPWLEELADQIGGETGEEGEYVPT